MVTRVSGYAVRVYGMPLRLFGDVCPLVTQLRLRVAMPTISNVGGSLTSALVIVSIAWAVRLLRIAAQRSGQERRERAKHTGRRMGRFASPVSPAALKLLVRRWALHPPCTGIHIHPKS